MIAITRVIFLDDEKNKFFGEGPCRLLHAIEKTGSLRAAAASMGMAYSKANHLIRHAEETLGFPLTSRNIGGRSGGGSTLTPEGKEYLERYEKYRDACVAANQKLYEEFYGTSSLKSEDDPE